MTFIKQQQAEAREKYAQDSGENSHNLLSAKDLDTLISKTITNTIKEVRGRMKGEHTTDRIGPEHPNYKAIGSNSYRTHVLSVLDEIEL